MSMTIDATSAELARQRRRQKCNMVEPLEHGPFTVKNTFLEVDCGESDNVLFEAFPTSPALSSPGKMESHYRRDNMNKLLAKTSYDWDTEDDIDGDSQPNFTKTPSSSTVTGSWNPSSSAFQGQQSHLACGIQQVPALSHSRRPSWEGPIGQDVVLSNLCANGAPFNGFYGHVTGFDHGTDRYSVVLDDFFPQVTCQVNAMNMTVTHHLRQTECY